MLNAGLLYAQAFDQGSHSTPSQLASSSSDRDYVLESLGIAVLGLEQAESGLDAPLSEIQFQKKMEHAFLMGNAEFEGSLAISVYSGGSATLLPESAEDQSTRQQI